MKIIKRSFHSSKLTVIGIAVLQAYQFFAFAENVESRTLPEGFAFGFLTEAAVEVEIELDPGEDKGGLILAFQDLEFGVASIGEDLVFGFQGSGLKLKQDLVINKRQKLRISSGVVLFSPSENKITPLSELTMSMEGVSDNEKSRVFWTPETFACYRDGVLLGVFDPSAKLFRSPTRSELDHLTETLALVSPKLDAAKTLLEKAEEAEAKRPKFPTVVRLWTDKTGRQIKGRVIDFSPDAETVTFEVGDDIHKDFPIGRFSQADADYLKLCQSGIQPPAE